MELTYINKNKFLLVGGIVVSIIAVLIFASLVFAGSTGTLLPSSDGFYKQWVRVPSGSTDYTAVDENACNGTTDYMREGTVDERESFGVSLSSVPNGAVITNIAITPCASRNNELGGGSSVLNVFYRWTGVDSADAGSYALTGTTPVNLATTSFSGLSLAKGVSSTLEIGSVFTSGNRGARVSRLAAVLTYVTAPAAPSNLDAVNATGTQNDLSWSDNSSDEDGFKVERSVNNQVGPFLQIATTSASAVSYNDTSLTADQTYYYRVRAFNVAGNSGYSNIDYAITATVVPSDPSNLTATASSSSAVLNWSQSSTNEEGFKVERSTNGANFAEIATKGINVTNHVDPGLAPGTYYYRVRAFNVIGNSGYSNTASTTIP